jgi:outer membrane protein TolC
MRFILSMLTIMLLWPEGLHAQVAQTPALQDPVGEKGQGPGALPQRAGSTPVIQDPLFGGLPAGRLSQEVLVLSIAEAIERGLRYNLAAVLSQEAIRASHGARQRVLSDFLPNLSAGLMESANQVNLKAMGFSAFPGIPTVVGPFSVFDTRLSLTQTILDFKALNDLRSETERGNAAELAYRNMRNQVASVCGILYLQALAGKSRIDAVRAHVRTAQELYDLARDRRQAGVVAGIDVVRAQVELQAQQQRQITAANEWEKEKLDLARAIGLPLGQAFDCADTLTYVAFVPMSLEEGVQRAYRERADYQGALARVRAAEFSKKAAEAERLPTLEGKANYGVNGPTPGQTHGNFAIAASLRIPIFDGGRVRALILEADATLRQRQAELEDLHARIYYEVQAALLDLQAAADGVRVAASTVELARDQLVQAQDRFSAGVANNLEVIQAQESLAVATDSYITSVFAHNVVKGRIAQILGIAEASFIQFLRGK